MAHVTRTVRHYGGAVVLILAISAAGIGVAAAAGAPAAVATLPPITWTCG